MTPRSSKWPGLRLVLRGAAGLLALVAVLPFVGGGGETPTLTGQTLSYVLVLLTLGAFLYGLLVFSGSLGVRALLLSGAVTGSLGVVATYLGGRPEALLDGPAVWPLTLLYVADLLRIAAAACLGFALARRVESPGIALLIAGLATAADLFSVFAGPTRALTESLEGGEPSLLGDLLGLLLVWFPTFGYPLGFALGVSDIIFLALFAAIAHHLPGLRPLPTLVLGCAAVLLAMLAALLLAGQPLPALPFITASFVLANAAPLARTLLPK